MYLPVFIQNLLMHLAEKILLMQPPIFNLGDAHIVRFGFRGALDGFCVV